ncbi:MAG: LacI family DNA-binding transcriptional regulator, partial [Anaerolineae bacterium]|nr:LacI family DNA-binding transcriptional regulator [Anaerolineae bacterium]
MAEIARLAGVSPATASRALRDSPLVVEETKERVKEIARQHNYHPHRGARNLRLQQSQTIVLFLPLHPETNQILSNPFILKFLGSVGSALHKHGYDFLVSQEGEVDRQLADRYLRSGLADGAIFLGRGPSADVFNEMATSRLPFVVWGPKLPGQRYCSVGIDNVDMGRKSVKHLAQHG